MKTEPQSAFYDNVIHPLVQQIHDACKKEGMPVFICIQDGSESFRSTIANAERSHFEKLKWMRFASNAWSKDELLSALISDAVEHGHDSKILYAMGIPENPA